jgi:hypothetical protein
MTGTKILHSMGDYVVRASNISPDPETGIGNWTLKQFIARFREYQGETGSTIPLGKDGPNSLMPWTMYADMREEDLAAIYSFLMQEEPHNNSVIIYEWNIRSRQIKPGKAADTCRQGSSRPLCPPAADPPGGHRRTARCPASRAGFSPAPATRGS